MNVLFLTAWYPSDRNPHKGIFVQEHARAIAAAGHNVQVVALDVSDGNSVFSEKYSVTTESGIRTHVISIHSRWHKKLYALYPILNRLVSKYIRSNVYGEMTPDIVHSNVLYPAGLIGHDIAAELHVPHVITEHWSKARRFLEVSLYRGRGKRAYREAAAVTCVSEFLKDYLKPHLNQTRHVLVIPNVVSAEFSSTFAPPDPLELQVTAVASWTKPKRPELFVNALNKAATDTGRKICLNIFGDGPQLMEFRNRKFSSSFRINFLGFASKREISKRVAGSHFFVHASDIETFSLVVAESLSVGTPVICSNRGALPELVSEIAGVLCENTEEDWAKKILVALTLQFDREAIKALYKNRFTQQTIGAEFSRLYSHITGAMITA